MKSRESKESGESSRRDQSKKKKKNEKRLGGKPSLSNPLPTPNRGPRVTIPQSSVSSIPFELTLNFSTNMMTNVELVQKDWILVS